MLQDLKLPDNYYKFMNVGLNSSNTFIKKRYKELAKKYHPDVSHGKTENLMKRLNEAYSVLSDPILRKRYDKNLIFLYKMRIDEIERGKWKYFNMSEAVCHVETSMRLGRFIDIGNVNGVPRIVSRKKVHLKIKDYFHGVVAVPSLDGKKLPYEKNTVLIKTPHASNLLQRDVTVKLKGFGLPYCKINEESYPMAFSYLRGDAIVTLEPSIPLLLFCALQKKCKNISNKAKILLTKAKKYCILLLDGFFSFV